MSLFENSEYVYRDTFFVFFNKENCPSADKIQAAIANLGPKYETQNIREKDGDFESLTFLSPYDHSAMDITLVEGEEVSSQVAELMEEFKTVTLVGDDHHKLSRFADVNARFDIFHFERKREDGNEDEFVDPGGLLLVMEKLVELSNGVGLDPASQTLM